MLNTRDEILFKFATEMDDFPDIPVPKPPVPTDLRPVDIDVEEEGDTEPTQIPIPIPIPEDTEDEKQISKREMPPRPPEEKFRKAYELALSNTHAFLTTTQSDFWGYKGWVKHPAVRPMVEYIMDGIVKNEPWIYFEWDLQKSRNGDILVEWFDAAAESYIDKNPIGAVENLMNSKISSARLDQHLPDLWLAAWEKVRGKYEHMDDPINMSRDPFEKGMTKLAFRLATLRPDVFDEYIKNTPFGKGGRVRRRRQTVKIKEQETQTEETMQGGPFMGQMQGFKKRR